MTMFGFFPALDEFLARKRLGVRHGRSHACLCSRGCRAQEKSPPVH